MATKNIEWALETDVVAGAGDDGLVPAIDSHDAGTDAAGLPAWH